MIGPVIPLLLAQLTDRSTLADTLVGGRDPAALREYDLPSAIELTIPKRGALVGYWQGASESFFPDFMVVNDEDFDDTLAWSSSYLNAFVPITQWCRIWRRSDFRRLENWAGPSPLPKGYSPWIGAIIAECGIRAGNTVSLREISGTAAIASATFSAARALVVWGEFADFGELAQRHDQLSTKLRNSANQFPAKNLLPIWYVLSGSRWEGKKPVDTSSLLVFSELLSAISETGAPDEDQLVRIVELATEEFDLLELRECARGPQQRRVEAVDKLASRLATGPASPAIDAILGFGASLVDVGAVVLPDLLRRYSSHFPLAPIWAGVFAGAWSPKRTLSDFNGLGRIIYKELHRTPDVFSTPKADVSFPELTRWLGPKTTSIPVRGLFARTLNVELIDGVHAAFPTIRHERSKTNTTAEQPTLDLGDNGRKPNRPPQAISLSSLQAQLDELRTAMDSFSNEMEELRKSNSQKSKKRNTKRTT